MRLERHFFDRVESFLSNLRFADNEFPFGGLTPLTPVRNAFESTLRETVDFRVLVGRK